MQYFRVPEKFGGCQIYNRKNNQYYTLVKNELYTQKECIKLGINSKVLDPVTVSKKNIYFFFGARFQI
jgi:hypothetical protein